jgi:hypothetical protein
MKKRSFTMINVKKMRLTMFAASMVAAGALTGCFNDKSSNPGAGEAASPVAFQNGAALGAISDAICTYANKLGTALPSEPSVVKTDANGTVDVNLNTVKASDYPVTITCTGGNYYDEATDKTRTLAATDTIQSIIPNAAAITQVSGKVGVNTFTDLAAKLLKKSGQTTPAAATAALKEIGRILAPGLTENGGELNLLGASTPVTSASPSLTQNNTATKLAVYLAGLAKVAQSKGVSPSDLGKSLASSISAGTAVDQTIVTALPAKSAEYANDKSTSAELKQDTTDDSAGSGGAAVEPKGDGTTGGTGGNSTGGNGTA